MISAAGRRFLWSTSLLLVLGCANEPSRDTDPTQGPSPDWPQWRGPARDGTTTDSGLLDSWSRGEPGEVWRRDLGDGFSGLSLAGEILYTLFAEGEEEYLVAIQARSGEELWRFTIGKTLIDSTGSGPRSTPAVSSGVVYLLGTHRALAVEAESGREIWSRPLAEPPLWGFSSSPLVHDGTVIFHAQIQGAEGAVTVLDQGTGDVIWTAEEGHPGYASPKLVEIGGRHQLLAFLGNGLVGLDPATGQRLWNHPWSTAYSVNAADPLFLPPDRVFVSSGYDNGSSLVRIQAADDTFSVEEVWTNRGMKNHFSSSVAVGDFVYGFDNATFKCLSLEDGQTQWSKRGFGKGSLVVAGEKLVVLGDNGMLALVQATSEEYRELGSAEVLEAGSWTPPSLAGAWLYVRDHRELVALYLGE